MCIQQVFRRKTTAKGMEAGTPGAVTGRTLRPTKTGEAGGAMSEFEEGGGGFVIEARLRELTRPEGDVTASESLSLRADSS